VFLSRTKVRSSSPWDHKVAKFWRLCGCSHQEITSEVCNNLSQFVTSNNSASVASRGENLKLQFQHPSMNNTIQTVAASSQKHLLNEHNIVIIDIVLSSFNPAKVGSDSNSRPLRATFKQDNENLQYFFLRIPYRPELSISTVVEASFFGLSQVTIKK
jgi:hypothetical protein